MGMDVLRCATPEMVHKEMWTCLLAYNLIRRTMLQSTLEAGVLPRVRSFTAAMQSIAASWLVIVLSDDALATLLIDATSLSLAAHVVGNRPGRVEARAVKRRYARDGSPASFIGPSARAATSPKPAIPINTAVVIPIGFMTFSMS